MAAPPGTGLALLSVGALVALWFVTWSLPATTWSLGAAPPLRRAWRRIWATRRWFLPGIAIGVFHVIAVNIIEPRMRPWWLSVTDVDFTGLVVAVEDGAVLWMENLHAPGLTVAVTWFYLVVHHALVIILPLFFVAHGETRLAHRYLLAIPITYLLAQPGFMFLPIDNPTVHYGLDSQLEKAIPGVDAIFYRGTTIDNTLPSMHIGLASMAFFHGRASALPRVRAFVTWYAPAVAFAIVYLQVHWFMDIAGGIAIAWIGTLLGARLAGHAGVQRTFSGGRAVAAP